METGTPDHKRPVSLPTAVCLPILQSNPVARRSTFDQLRHPRACESGRQTVFARSGRSPVSVDVSLRGGGTEKNYSMSHLISYWGTITVVEVYYCPQNLYRRRPTDFL